MVTTSGRIPVLSLIASLLLISNLYAFWGMRDYPEDGVDSLLERLYPEELLITVRWSECEPAAGEFDWAELDSSLVKCRVGRWTCIAPTVVIDPVSEWATGGEWRAPDDLDFDTDLNEPMGRFGYSRTLYNFTYELMTRCQQQLLPDYPWRSIDLSVVLGNDIASNWITTDSTLHRDLEGYRRSLRTVAKAVKDFDEEGDDSGHRFVMWGDIDLSPAIDADWLQAGNDAPEQRAEILGQVRFLHQRIANRFENWEAYQAWMATAEMARKLAWIDLLSQEARTVSYFNMRLTCKPHFLSEVVAAFISDIPNFNGKDWKSTFAAFELEGGGEVEYSAEFLESDYARRFVSAIKDDFVSIFVPLISDTNGQWLGLLPEAGRVTRGADVFRAMRFEMFMPVDYFNGEENGAVSNVSMLGAFPDGENNYKTFYWINSPDDLDTALALIFVETPQEGSGPISAAVDVRGDTIEYFGDDLHLWLRVTTTPSHISNYYGGGGVAAEGGGVPEEFNLVATFPNPFNSSLSVEFIAHRPGEFILELIGLDGRSISSRSIVVTQPGERQESFSLPDLPSGEYVLRLSNGKLTTQRKVVLIR